MRGARVALAEANNHDLPIILIVVHARAHKCVACVREKPVLGLVALVARANQHTHTHAHSYERMFSFQRQAGRLTRVVPHAHCVHGITILYIYFERKLVHARLTPQTKINNQRKSTYERFGARRQRPRSAGTRTRTHTRTLTNACDFINSICV